VAVLMVPSSAQGRRGCTTHRPTSGSLAARSPSAAAEAEPGPKLGPETFA